MRPSLSKADLAALIACALLLLALVPVALAQNAELANRGTCALFDPARFARNIEAAYTTMWETWQRGEGPKGFAVEPSRA